VLVQHWARAWGLGWFLALMFGFLGVFSFGLMPLFHGRLREIEWAAWRWLIPGALLMALNNVGFSAALGHWGDATAANIVYSSRGLWSVVLVWAVGHWFGNQERHAGGSAMTARLVGASLMVVAIVLVLK